MVKHPTPRVFIVRHGETEWSLNGRHTGTTDIPLTANGERRISATGRALVGDDRLIVRRNLAAVLVSPRTRAQRTVSLLLEAGGIPVSAVNPQTTQDIREWDYGDYEGRVTKDIQAERHSQGLPDWEIWRDGCPGGESPQQITERLDRLIAEIRDKYHAPALKHIQAGKERRCPPCDVLVVAHGHILRAFAARWVGRTVTQNPSLVLEAGGVGTLSYEHHNIAEPAILLGGAFVVDVAEPAVPEETKM